MTDRSGKRFAPSGDTPSTRALAAELPVLGGPTHPGQPATLLEAARTLRVLNKKQVASLAGFSPSTLDNLVATGNFPPPLQLSARRVGWRIATIEAWLESRVRTEGAS